MVKIRNVTQGPKGIHDAAGNLVMLEKGQEADLELSDAELAGAREGDWFTVDGELGGKKAAPAEPGPLDGSIADLEEHVAGVDDAAEIQGLIDQETGGKSRKGALDVLNARLEELSEA